MSRATLLFFWDYDTQWGGDRSRGPGGPKTWGPLEFENTEELLKLHAEFGIPACFAVVGAAALNGDRPYHDAEQVRRIHAAGHEVGSHSFRHDWIPGLGRQKLAESLRSSKEALEQCIGAPVETFVPPYNQPFDYPRGWSFSLSERREAGADRVDLADLCRALGEAGYRFCRVAYRPVVQRLKETLLRKRLDRPVALERINDVACVRLNTPGGFKSPTPETVERCAASGGIVVVYGHPHSIHTGNAQDAIFLVPLMEKVRTLVHKGLLRVALPRELLEEM